MSLYHLPTLTERMPRKRELRPGSTVDYVDRPENGWDPDLLEYLGFVEIVEIPRPPDDDVNHYVAGTSRKFNVVTRVWTAVPWTAQELADRAAAKALALKAANINAAKITWLRNAATTASSTTATTANVVAVTNGILANLAVFYAAFADFLEGNRFVK